MTRPRLIGRRPTSAVLHALLIYAGLIAAADRRPYKKIVREQSQRRTRDALLDAADEEFYSDRWQKASLEALAKKAGVTKQTDAIERLLAEAR
jgi:hypothetical protein